ncbi:MAG: hydroxymethylglutaryl-CoA synthase [Streblomastix strix]|uniref:Hydroxymethylglutaryl-CoA synthase n=1 Tax=Streblomastix strix TaxID=222440 RepID=A0A5J4X967_9EUKA|nr:MAG: hydroxymethylglutaryl-CoA synthase [Streblomastix strix]
MEVGISAIEFYWPTRFVSQKALESADGVKGKYTDGLGQEEMVFTSWREDAVSMALTVTQRLIQRNNIHSKDIGRIEVGTESIIDHSKSIKTHLLSLFGGSCHAEGVDCVNACFGGTQALFNAVDYVHVHEKNAIVVCTDIAVYEEKAARPTGGCGAIAMLITKNAPLVVENHRVSYSENQYDFFKPFLNSEYPKVESNSQQCYLKAVDNCAHQLLQELNENNINNTIHLLLHNNFDYLIFHTPFVRMIRKAFTRILLQERKYVKELNTTRKEKYEIKIPFPDFVKYDELLDENEDLEQKENKDKKQHFLQLQKDLLNDSNLLFDKYVGPSTNLPRIIGNSYTSSIFIALCSLLHSFIVINQKEQQQGQKEKIEHEQEREYKVYEEIAQKMNRKRILCFSYGSGFVSALWIIRVAYQPSSSSTHFTLNNILQSLDQNLNYIINGKIEQNIEEYERV